MQATTSLMQWWEPCYLQSRVICKTVLFGDRLVTEASHHFTNAMMGARSLESRIDYWTARAQSIFSAIQKLFCIPTIYELFQWKLKSQTKKLHQKRLWGFEYSTVGLYVTCGNINFTVWAVRAVEKFFNFGFGFHNSHKQNEFKIIFSVLH